MIEVVSAPGRFRITCNGCTAILEYTGDEVKPLPAGSRKIYRITEPGIYCPVCSKRLSHKDSSPAPTPSHALALG